MQWVGWGWGGFTILCMLHMFVYLVHWAGVCILGSFCIFAHLGPMVVFLDIWRHSAPRNLHYMQISGGKTKF